MIASFPEYPALGSRVPQRVALLGTSEAIPTLPQLTVKIPWGKNLILVEKIKDLPIRLWYVQQTDLPPWTGRSGRSAARRLTYRSL
jgi:hypothetical protein